MIDFSLSEDLQAIRARACKFAQEEILPIAAEYDRKAEVPPGIVQKARAAGLLNVTIPREYGGMSYGALESAMIAEELGAACVGISITILVNGLALTPLMLFGTEAQKQQFLKPVAEEARLAAFCLTEREAGSDAGSIKTTALPDGDDLVINGQKCFVTSGSMASILIVFAQTEPDRGARGVSAMVVPADTPGISVIKVEEKMGQRASNTAELAFENVRVPQANILGKRGRGFGIALETLDFGRSGVAALSVGLARAALEHATNYAKQRQQFGAPIINNQAVAFMLADMAIKVEAARLLTWQAAWSVDQGLKATAKSAMAKCFASDTAMQVTTDAVQIFGGVGYMKDHPVEKLMRDAKLLQIYEGTNQIQRMVIARQLGK
ncbi:MAG TPA: acyl-CoA dehydrogenase family protein [Anaerolineae bacterium]|nr:acyl-CoA dehydrogenase family protein [Anaerolineae bacterium]